VSQDIDSYLMDTTALLNDSSYLFNNRTQLIRWINRGRSQVAKISGCLRAFVAGTPPYGVSAQAGAFLAGAAIPGQNPLSTFATIPGVELYPYNFGKPYARQALQGVNAIYDVANVAISWGAAKPALAYLPWQDLQAYARSYNVLVTSYPQIFSTSGDGENQQVWLYPIPTQAIEMEWDCFCSPAAINNPGDYDCIPAPFDDSIKFYAAGMAFFQSYRYANAGAMFELFLSHLGVDRAASDRGKIAGYYWYAALM
jgi:hypothetical protein